MPPLDRSRARRRAALAWQVLLVLALAAAVAVAAVVSHALQSLRARGVQAGFDFLWQSAGFEIGESWLHYEPGQPFWRAFLAGLANTVRVAVPALVLATLLGAALGVARVSRHALLRGAAGAYVEAVRNVPLLVQLLMAYFLLTEWLPDATEPLHAAGLYLSKSGLSLPWPVHGDGGAWALEWPQRSAFNVSGGAALTPEYLAVGAALAVYTAAFVAEAVRAGLQAVPRGQHQAAQALGLQPWHQLRHVVGPQALRVIVPAYTNQALNLTKNSTLAVAVGYPDLVSVSNTALNQTGRAFECIAVIMAVYLSLSLFTSALLNLYNARVVLRGQAQ